MRALWLAVLLALSPGCAGDDGAPARTTTEMARITGEWRIVLSPEQRRQVRVMRYVLQQPTPSDEALLGAGFRDSEAQTAVTLLREVRADPDGQRVAQLRATVAQLEDTAMLLTTDRLRMQLGQSTMEAGCELLEVNGDTFTLRTSDMEGNEQQVVLTLANDELVLGEGDEQMRFVRR